MSSGGFRPRRFWSRAGPASHVGQDQPPGMAALIPGCELVTIPAWHLVHAVRPAEFAAAVTAFLEGEVNDNFVARRASVQAIQMHPDDRNAARGRQSH